MSTTSQKVIAGAVWTKETWAEIQDLVSAKFRLSASEREGLAESRVAQLIASIPYLAGSSNAKRVSLANMAVYMMSFGESKEAFNATTDDDADVFARLRLANFGDGDPQIIERGLAMIALNMVADYRRDTVTDLVNGKHNPVATASWDYEKLEAELIETIESIDCPQMDEITSVPQVMDAFWAIGARGSGWF
jgi:hypothetical protein